jgi:hypothetical protein
MDRVPFNSVLRETAGLAGFTLGQLTSSVKTQLRTFINRQAASAWEHAWWSQLMHAEERFYRPAYDAGATYAVDDEVYYATTGLYYRATASGSAHAPTDTNYWEEITDLAAYIDLEQDGEEPIGTVRLLSKDDPTEVDEPRSVRFRLIARRIYVLGDPVPSSVYVWFREPVPSWLGDDFDATVANEVDDIVYFEGTTSDFVGDFWKCTVGTLAGESPESAPTKWERVEFPAWLQTSVAQAAYSDWLRQDGNPEAARIEQAVALQYLLKAVHRDGPAQRQLLRAAGA